MFSVGFHEVGNLTVAWVTAFVLHFLDDGMDGSSQALLGVALGFVGLSYGKSVLKDYANKEKDSVGDYVVQNVDWCGCLEQLNEFLDE